MNVTTSIQCIAVYYKGMAVLPINNGENDE